MIRIAQLTLARGIKPLLTDASVVIHAGHKAGLVGPNGCGKSSLFALLRGELHADRGEVSLPPAGRIAHVAQETPSSSRAALDYTLDGDTDLRAIEAALAQEHGSHADDAHESGERIALLHHRFELVDGYTARARAASMLSGLGFSVEQQSQAVSSFSGGWRMRLNLAQALMARSDLLLLDEPTNHLDLDAVLWLEEWLARYPGTLLLISHDRDFLDAVVGQIIAFENGKLRSYTGNYEQFERERAQGLALQQNAFVKQQRQIAHLRSFIDRFRAKATKAKQAQSRMKTLERMELIAAAHVDSPFSFSFSNERIQARQLVKLEHARLGYGDKTILSDVDWQVLAGARIGLLGPNGAGKSTLLRTIAGDLAPLAGERLPAQGLRIGYFAQHQVEQLRVEHSPLWHLRRIEPDTREQTLRDFIGGFDFRGDRVTSPVSEFSGGEKARLTLALLVRQKPNLLLLDEPTNHLDIEMREALTEALQDYEGALIVIAHDRYLLRATTDELWLVADGRLAPFDGDLDDYRRWVLTQRSSAPTPVHNAPSTEPAPDRKAVKRAEAEARQRLAQRRKPLLDRIGRVETEMKTLTDDKAKLDEWLASAEAYSDSNKDELKQAIARQGDLAWQLARAEAAWLDLQETLENADASQEPDGQRAGKVAGEA